LTGVILNFIHSASLKIQGWIGLQNDLAIFAPCDTCVKGCNGS